MSRTDFEVVPERCCAGGTGTGRRWLGLMGVTVLLMAGLAGKGGGASATQSQPAEPTVTVEPATDLVDGQRVTLEGDGFAAEDFAAWVYQCPAAAESFDQCDGSTLQLEQAVDGGFSLTFPVRTVLRGPDGAEIDCRVADACALGVGTGELVDPQLQVLVPLHFDPEGGLLDPPILSVDPSEALVDGQTVRVVGNGFVRDDSVSVMQCPTDPASDGSGCSQENAGLASTEDGTFELDLEVAAVIDTTSGLVDCRVPGQCVVAAMAAGDTVVAAVSFDPDAPLLPRPVLSVSPATELVDGQTVRLDGSGFPLDDFGSGGVLIFQCGPVPSPESCRRLGNNRLPIGPDGSFTTEVPVAAQMPTGEGLLDCRNGPEPCLLVASTSVWPDSPRAGLAEIRFDPGGPLLPEPEIEVTPVDGLGDLSTLMVRGSHFAPRGLAAVRVCLADVVPQRCDDAAGEHPTADDAGGFELDVSAWATWTDSEGGADCRQPPGCVVTATDETRGLSASVPLSFGPPDPPRGRYFDPIFDDVEVDRDLVYRETVDHHGNPVQLKLDIYRPAGDTATRRPVAIWMHGGYFQTGDKSDMYNVATEYARRGYVGVSLQYRLRPDMAIDDLASVYQASLDAHDDAVAAIQWLRDHADEYGLDPDAIVAGGYSAGAVISLHLAYGPGQHGPDTSPIAAALPVAGLYTFPPDQGEPPSIVFHSTADTVLPVNNGDEICALAQQLDIACELVAWDGADHDFRVREVVRRGTDFVAAQVLEPAGYFDVAADAGGPYEVTEGSTVTLDGSGGGR